MKLSITGRHVTVTPALESILEKKLRSVAKFFPEDAVADVVLTVERNRQTIEVTVRSADMIVRSERTGQDLYTCIDEVVDKLERQISKNRTKLENRLKTPIPAPGGAPAEEEEDFIPSVVKTKRFAVKPMSEDEAVLQMELLGHNFFVFRNSSSGEVNVLYRRNDGNYGLIEPDADR